MPRGLADTLLALSRSVAATCPVKHEQAGGAAGSSSGGGGGCPVHSASGGSGGNGNGNAGGGSACPVSSARSEKGGGGGGSGCPMRGGAAGASAADGAKSPLNPANMMPAAANQQPAQGQKGALPTERVTSTIPNGEGESWVYPSPQMFYNALVRKGKVEAEGGEDVEANMSTVVAIHNNMNEKTWKQVLEWEEQHCDTCSAPRRLLRFVGRPHELSTKAYLRYHLGLSEKPFDRHDWVVDRCGTEVRYIIDYYDVPEQRSADRVPQLHDPDSVPSIRIDVRPALDSPGALVDRIRATVRGSAAPRPAPEAAAGAASATSEVAREVERVHTNCSERMAQLKACANERECALAHIGLTTCIAKQVCAREVAAFEAMRGTADEKGAAARMSDMEDCVARWGAKASAGVGEPGH